MRVQKMGFIAPMHGASHGTWAGIFSCWTGSSLSAHHSEEWMTSMSQSRITRSSAKSGSVARNRLTLGIELGRHLAMVWSVPRVQKERASATLHPGIGQTHGEHLPTARRKIGRDDQ